ncbi:PD40 domain-containing protein [Paenibacillus sp. OV219]|uniref:TolB family protein n=1 Tax=Paenibacillus sp. OV219 TaxID=1884377 RepID=UPI0008BE67DE|nr:PD40 domain-containing protein [Paenibacillus sp. OV219]SEO38448.1 WD40-like Beta Propeller Repeat [Paenibacillus sp. OV219]
MRNDRARLQMWLRRGILPALLLAAVFFSGAVQAKTAEPMPKKPLMAAFIRDGALWVKVDGGGERRLTEANQVRGPKWSADGAWFAYTRGENGQDLWMVHVASGKSRLVAAGADGRRYVWSPNRGLLAFERNQRLYVVGTADTSQPVEVTGAVGDIGDYAWLPNGDGFLVSTAAHLLPDGAWTPVRLIEVMLPSGPAAGGSRAKPLTVLPAKLNDQVVVGTSTFKWSASGKWIAFLATPTASLSADGNTLCVLSSDGKQLKPVDMMVNNANWFEWSAETDSLGLISGIGREAISNKQLKVAVAPAFRPGPSYTPAGYADQNFTWLTRSDIVVQRAKESGGISNPEQRPFPNLVNVKLSGGQQKRITRSSTEAGDYQPVALGVNGLAWVRSNKSTADVMLTPPEKIGKKASVWIKDIDIGDNFYEQWSWGSVLKFY